MQGDGKGGDLSGFGLQEVDLAGLLEDDLVHPARGPKDIGVGEVGHLLDVPALEVKGVEVEGEIPVGDEVNLLADPEGLLICAGEVGDPVGGVLVQIVDPDVLGAAALVTLPVAEIPLDGGVDNLMAVRGEVAHAGLGNGQGHLQAPFQVHQEVLSHALAPRGTVRPDHDRAAVGRPVQDDVVKPATGRHLADIVVEGELFGCPSLGRDHVDLPVSGVLPGEGDPLAVGRDLGKEFPTHVGCETSRLSSGEGDRPDVAGVDEGDQVARDVGVVKEPTLSAQRGQGKDKKEQDRKADDSLHEASLRLLGCCR